MKKSTSGMVKGLKQHELSAIFMHGQQTIGECLYGTGIGVKQMDIIV